MYDYYESTDEYILAIDKLFVNGEYIEGKKLIEELLEEDPSCAAAHNSLGWIYFYKLDKYELAAKHFKLAIRFDPKYPFAYRNHVYLNMYLGNYKIVINMIKRAIKVKGSEVANLYNEMGKAFEILGLLIDARTSYKKALQYNTDEDNKLVYRANAKRAFAKMSLLKKLKSYLIINSD